VGDQPKVKLLPTEHNTTQKNTHIYMPEVRLELVNPGYDQSRLAP
jgi:hypothetical protein